MTFPEEFSGADRKRVLPLSSMRFFLAVWVVMGHYGLPIFGQVAPGSLIWALRALLNNSFNGPAAVIVFFIISGFCIHFPNRRKLEVRSWKRYYARRYIRILIPMTVAVALSAPLNLRLTLFADSILWSLLCEEIYYFLYPGLLFLRDRLGWSRLMTMAWILAFLVVVTNPRALAYPSYGPRLNWLLGLPCWLLGCRLAERLETFPGIDVSAGQVWKWRGGAWILSSAMSIMRFHTPIGYPWTLNLFAIYASVWLEREIYYYRFKGPSVFEKLGEASYSVYLTHLHGVAILGTLTIAAGLSPFRMWVCSVVLCCAIATVFYWLVERPSHRLARCLTMQAGRLAVTPALHSR